MDPDRQVVVLDHGEEVGYDELLVAVGGQPVKGTDQGTGFEPASPDTVAGSPPTSSSAGRSRWP